MLRFISHPPSVIHFICESVLHLCAEESAESVSVSEEEGEGEEQEEVKSAFSFSFSFSSVHHLVLGPVQAGSRALQKHLCNALLFVSLLLTLSSKIANMPVAPRESGMAPSLSLLI